MMPDEEIFQLDDMINEKYLFYSASEETCEKIKHEGFSDRKGEAKSMSFGCQGAGAYFAENVSKADEYSHVSNKDNETRYMFLARVALGDFHTTNIESIGFHEPPRLFDSVVFNNLQEQYREFSVYDAKDQCYPEYLIEYIQI
jgi:hypothetical protein